MQIENENVACVLCMDMALRDYKEKERASKPVELSTTAPNSDYATALKVYDEWHESTCDSDNLPFRGWLSQRLNASTHIA